MLLSGANKSTSTLSTSTRSNIKPAQKKKDNFIVYSFKQIWSFLAGFWTRFRKFMWIGSTGILYIKVRFYNISSTLCFRLYAIDAKLNDQNDGK